jgi:clan AA aspartic protease (TIGR02281 family)
LWAKFFWIFLLLVLCAPNDEPAANEFYRWFDDKGTLHANDDLKSVPELYRKTSRETRAVPLRGSSIATSQGNHPKATGPQRYILPLTWEGGRLFVDAKINQRVPVRYIVDTGANMTIIPASLALRLGFDKRNSLAIDIRGVGGIIEGRLIDVDSLKVGEAEASNFDMVAVQDSLGGIALLGADFLSRFRVEIDYAGGQMVLHPGESPYEGYPASWWQERFRLYDRLKHMYERRISQNHHRVRSLGPSGASRNPEVRYDRGVGPLAPVSDEIKEYENYLTILANKISALQIRANRAALPQSYRQ